MMDKRIFLKEEYTATFLGLAWMVFKDGHRDEEDSGPRAIREWTVTAALIMNKWILSLSQVHLKVIWTLSRVSLHF